MDADIRFGSALLRFRSRFIPILAPIPGGKQAGGARREFLMEMPDRNPDAFASAHDVRSMMRLYPGRF